MRLLHDLRRIVCPLHQLRPLSVAEAAKALRCRRKEVEALIREGNLPFIKRRGRRYILPADIHKRLKEESQCETSSDGHVMRHASKYPQSEIGDIDPYLCEFFD